MCGGGGEKCGLPGPKEQRDAVVEEVIQAACSCGASANHNAFCFGMPGEELRHAALSSFSTVFDLDVRKRANGGSNEATPAFRVRPPCY